ncbi:aspartate/glutamate racemase family protein [Govanella unica]|uniref:Aspartate/glutamate racemase family protein n=1 Tax=Govanella unica TaxID=2975056 RepID=A0A9X3TZY9_9PROT|nr:aspartate/glutamate racemase family protein [Govania unica]MDA5194454.1 aspartate/glutamate racemase family protein [Govania unica]
MKRIQVISPVLQSDALLPMVRDILDFSRADNTLDISHVFLDKGPDCIENYIDRAVAGGGLLRQAMEAEQAGFDGVIINCMADPGLYSVREALTIPVVGIAEAAMHMAAMLGHRFGFIDVVESTRTMVSDQAARYGLSGRYGAFRGISIPVLEIETDPQRTADLLIKAGMSAVMEDHVDVLILGCATLLGPGVAMAEAFKQEGLSIPIINPLPLAINVMGSIVKSGLSHSKKAYPLPVSRSFQNLLSV